MSVQVFLGCVLVVSLAAGLVATRWLRSQRHRLADEADLPRRSHLWVAIAMPLAALVTAAGVAGRWPWWVAIGPVLLVLLWLLAAGIDADVGRLPDVLTLPLAGLAMVWGLALAVVFGDPSAALRTVLGGLGLGVCYLALMLLSRAIPPHREGIGAGDVKLAVSIGAALGWFSWLGLIGGTLLGLAIGAVWALVLLIARRAGRHDSFSLGPALVLGAALAFVVA